MITQAEEWIANTVYCSKYDIDVYSYYTCDPIIIINIDIACMLFPEFSLIFIKLPPQAATYLEVIKEKEQI